MSLTKIHVLKANPTPRNGRAKRPAAQLNIREACFDDYEPITALQVRNGLITRSREDWAAFWNGNPVYDRLKPDWPMGWVLEAEGGAIVGSIGNIPMIYYLNGRELRAASACSWVVDPRYRGYSMLMLDKLTSQKGADLTLSTTVSPNAEPAFKVFHWSKAPVGTWNKSAFWITGYRGFANSILSMKSAPCAGMLSYPLSAALFCWDRLRIQGALPGGSNYEMETCSTFDDRFDHFWRELKDENPHVLLAERTSKTLSWHFRYALDRQNAWILTVSKGSRMVAYAIFDRQDNAAYSLKRVRLVDFQALRGFEKLLPSVLRWMLRKCVEQGVHIMENVGCWLDRPGLPHVRAPHHRKLASSMFYYKTNDPGLREILKNREVWAPSPFDGDVSL